MSIHITVTRAGNADGAETGGWDLPVVVQGLMAAQAVRGMMHGSAHRHSSHHCDQPGVGILSMTAGGGIMNDR